MLLTNLFCPDLNKQKCRNLNACQMLSDCLPECLMCLVDWQTANSISQLARKLSRVWLGRGEDFVEPFGDQIKHTLLQLIVHSRVHNLHLFSI